MNDCFCLLHILTLFHVLILYYDNRFAPWGVGKSKLWYLIRQKLTDADELKQQQETRKKELSKDENSVLHDKWKFTRFIFLWTVACISQLMEKIPNCTEREAASAEDVSIWWLICCCPLALFVPVVTDVLQSFHFHLRSKSEERGKFSRILLRWPILPLLLPLAFVIQKMEKRISCIDTNDKAMASKVYDIVTGHTFNGLKAKLCRKTLPDSIHVLVLLVIGIIVKLIRYVLLATFSVCTSIVKFLIGVPNTKKGDIEEGKKTKGDYPFTHIHVEFNAWSYDGSDNLWASLIKTLQDEIYKAYNPRSIKWHRVSVALAGGESLDDTLEVRSEKRQKALRTFFITTTVTGILAFGGIFTAIYFVFLFDDKFCPKTAKASICNDMVRNMVGLLMTIASPIPFSIQIYTIFFKVLPFLKTPKDILLHLATKTTGAGDFRAKMGFMGEVQTEMNFLFDFIRNTLISLPNGVEVLGRLSIFVDDLDRCNPKTIQSVLDAIHLMLETNNGDRCVATCWIAVDTRIVVSSIDEVNGGVLRNAGVNGYDYMEKLIQVPFSIPLMTARNKERLMTKMTTPLVSEAKIDAQLRYILEKFHRSKPASEVIDEDPRFRDLRILKGVIEFDPGLQIIKDVVRHERASSYAQQLAKDFDNEDEIFVASKYVRHIESLTMLLSTPYSRASTSRVENVRDKVEEEAAVEVDSADLPCGSGGDDGTIFTMDKHECVSGSMQPDEERWMRQLSHLFPSRARSLKRVMNIYTVGRQVH